jgi:hypothetical protein
LWARVKLGFSDVAVTVSIPARKQGCGVEAAAATAAATWCTATWCAATGRCALRCATRCAARRSTRCAATAATKIGKEGFEFSLRNDLHFRIADLHRRCIGIQSCE